MATIALDAMGGDFGPEVVIPAAVHAVKKIKDLHIILVGDEARLRDFANEHNINLDKHFSIEHASQVVEMHEDPRHAVRKKKDSSMRVAINLVKEGRAQAVVSAGNTGALMATAKFVLKLHLHVRLEVYLRILKLLNIFLRLTVLLLPKLLCIQDA